VNCRVYDRNRTNFGKSFKNDYPINSRKNYRQNCNRFGYLSKEVECHICNKFGHLAKDGRLTAPPRESQQNQNAPPRVKKKKTERLAIKAQSKKNVWYVDSGCSTHMTRDKTKFISLKERKRWNNIFWK